MGLLENAAVLGVESSQLPWVSQLQLLLSCPHRARLADGGVRARGDRSAGRGHTNEDIPYASFPSILISKPTFVLLETGETDGHLGYDTRENGAKALVQSQWRFSPDDISARSDEPSSLCLGRALDAAGRPSQR